MRLALAGLVLATVWYVKAGAPPGGNGSAANPFMTIAAGVAAADAGDTVMVLPGSYQENVSATKNGVTLLAQTRGTVLVDGTSGSGLGTLEIHGVNWVVDGLELRNGDQRSLLVAPPVCPSAGALELSHVITSGAPRPPAGSCTAAANYDSYGAEVRCLSGSVWIHDSTFAGSPCTANLALTNLPAGALVEINDLSGAHGSPLLLAQVDGGEVRRNLFHSPCCDGQVGPGVNAAGISIDGASRGLFIHHNVLTSTGLWGISAFDPGNLHTAEGHSVRNNTIVGPRLAGIHLDAVDALARSNLVSNVTCPPGQCPLGCPNPAGLISENTEGGLSPAANVGWDLFDPATVTATYCTDGGATVVDAGPVTRAAPGFVAGNDFHLAAGSLAIDHGDPGTPPGLDFDGQPVVTARDPLADIGAYEYPDGGPGDGGLFDAGAADSGAGDSGAADSGSSDSGAADSGNADAGFLDAGAFDAGRFPIAILRPTSATVDAGATVELDGRASIAPPGAQIVGFDWSEPEGPAFVSLGTAGLQPAVVPVPGDYRFRLVVRDSLGGQSAPAEAHIHVSGVVPQPSFGTGCGCGHPGAPVAAALALLLLRLRGSRRSSR